jgi:hypothetical protein
MPTKTSPSLRPADALRAAAIGAAYASAEAGAAALLGFGDTGRAEALLFLALRPWLLILLAALLATLPLRPRLAAYAASLLIAGTSEALLLAHLGAPNPWPEALRGLAAGALILLLADLGVQAAAKRFGRGGRGLAALLLALLLLLPGALAPYRLLAFPQPTKASTKPAITLMTALPLVWGEGGAFDPASRPAASYRALQQEFTLHPIDTLDAQSLARAPTLLLAQPRWLAPAELVALDSWVRQGGRALILADPTLVWPSKLPLGDIRRPPPTSLLAPLLTHWGLSLEAPAAPTLALHRFGTRSVGLHAPGRLSATGRACRTDPAGTLAHCTLGKGRATILADADILRDELWIGPGDLGATRDWRIADNPIWVADQFDALAGAARPRALGDVAWADPHENPGQAAGILGLILAGIAAAMLLRLRVRAR